MLSYQMDCFPAVNSSSHSMSSLKSTSNSKKDKKKNCRNKSKGSSVKLSTDPQSVAARERRHRISDRFKILQSMIPGGTKMDTVSMLEEAIHYVKFLKTQIWLHQTMVNFADDDPSMLLSGYSATPQQQPLCPLEDFVEGMQCLPHQLPLHGDQIQPPCFQGEDTLFFDTADVNYWAANGVEQTWSMNAAV